MKNIVKSILFSVYIFIATAELFGQTIDSTSHIKNKIEHTRLGFSGNFSYISRRTFAYEAKYTFAMPIFEFYKSIHPKVSGPLITWLKKLKPNIAVGYQDIREDHMVQSDSIAKKYSGHGIYVAVGARKSIHTDILGYSVLMQLMYVTPDNDDYDNDLIFTVGGFVDFWLSKRSYFSIGYLFDSRDLYGGNVYYPLKLKSSFRWVYFI